MSFRGLSIILDWKGHKYNVKYSPRLSAFLIPRHQGWGRKIKKKKKPNTWSFEHEAECGRRIDPAGKAFGFKAEATMLKREEKRSEERVSQIPSKVNSLYLDKFL